MQPDPTPTIREATEQDCPAIAALARRTFAATFGDRLRPENLDAYLNARFSTEYFVQSLATGDTVLMLHAGEALIGYAKVGRLGLPVKPPVPKGAQEIYRVYVDQAYQGQGLGKAMMLHILSLPRVATAPAVYLGVCEGNITAQALYTQYAFQPVGRHLYYVGDESDREIIMARVK